MKNIFIIIACLLCFVNFCFSQEDKYEGAFLNIKVYRDSLTGSLLNNDLNNIKIKRHLELGENDTAYLGLNEEEILLLVTGRYDILLDDILKKDTKLGKGSNMRTINVKDKKSRKNYKNRDSYLYYYGDSLSTVVKRYIKDNETFIRKDIINSGLDSASEDFLQLLLDYYLAISDFCDSVQDQEMISNSKLFLEKYPDSKYVDFVEDYINIEFKEGSWGLGMHVNAGTVFFSGELAGTFSSPVLMFVDIDVNYKKFMLNFGIGGTIYSNLKQSFYYDTLWLANHQFSFAPVVSAVLGYQVYNTRKVNITPFIGAGVVAVHGRVRNDSLYYENIRMLSQNPLTLGICFDYKFGHGTCKSGYMNRRGGYKEDIYANLRLKLSFQPPQFNKISEGLKGGLWFITAGIGFNSYPPGKIMKRKR